MKRFVSILLALCLVFSVTCVFAAGEDVKITLDGTELVPADAFGNRVYPIIENGSTYLPVRAIAKALDISIAWDNATKTVFIGTAGGNPSIGDNVNIFIDGKEFNATDANGNAVYPILLNGTTYLPVRAIATAFGMSVKWDDATRTVVLTSPEPEKVDAALLKNATDVKNGTFALRNANSGKYATAAETEGSATAFSDTPVAWTLESVTEEYYQVVYMGSEVALDVNGVSTLPGGNLIVWTKSGADNQLCKFTKQSDGSYIITVKHSSLNIESDGTQLIQNKASGSTAQRWILEEIVTTPQTQQQSSGLTAATSVIGTVVFAKQGTTKVLKVNDDNLTLSLTEYVKGDTSQQWVVSGTSGAPIQNVKSGFYLDVSAQSMDAGGDLIVWEGNGGENQKWDIEKSGNGYVLKSCFSGLYLSDVDNIKQQNSGTVFIVSLP